MALYNLPNATTGADEILKETITAVPQIPSLILVFVFLIVFLGGVGRQKRRDRDVDYAMWSVVASLSTFLIALIMSIVEGIINLDVLIVVTVITIFSGVWLFLDKKTGV